MYPHGSVGSHHLRMPTLISPLAWLALCSDAPVVHLDALHRECSTVPDCGRCLILPWLDRIICSFTVERRFTYADNWGGTSVQVLRSCVTMLFTVYRWWSQKYEETVTNITTYTAAATTTSSTSTTTKCYNCCCCCCYRVTGVIMGNVSTAIPVASFSFGLCYVIVA